MAGSAGADLLTTVGHGGLGLRSGLRTFAAFMDDSVSRKDVSVEVRPGIVLPHWSLQGGGMYSSPCDYTFRGARLDVVAVRTPNDVNLTRAESLTLCQSTAGTFFFDPDGVFSLPALVFDTGPTFDNGFYYDQFAQLYLHLSDGSDPTLTTVSVSFGLYFATRAMIQPLLGSTMVVDGDFANWTAGVPNSWTVDSGTVAQDTTVAYGTKSSSINLTLTSAANGATSRVYQAVTLQAGKRYRISGYYQTPASNPTLMQPQFRLTDGAGANDIYLDGRSVSGSGIFPTPTSGEWMKFVFDFVAPQSSCRLYVGMQNNTGGTASGSIWFDGVSLQRIFRFNYYDPRVLPKSIPALQTGSKDIFFGGKQIGSANIQLINTDGALEKIAGAYDWLNHDVLVFAGAEFKDGQEILYEDWRQQFSGRIQQLDCDDHIVTLGCTDIRVFFHVQLPGNAYDDQQLPGMDPQLVGKPRPLWFGPKQNITPIRIGIETTFNKYGVYELADCSLAPNGIYSVDFVYAYTSSTMARDKRTDQRLTLTAGTSYSVNLATAQITLLQDVGPYVVLTTNNLLDFDIGASALLATLTPGLYTAAGLAAHITTQMTAAAGTAVTCSYDDNANKFTFSKTSGTLNLRNQSGAHASAGPWALVGFNRTTDRTGALSYLGDNATFVDNEKSFFLRVDGKGYKDTAAGKYTGTASALITVGADICQVLIEKFLKKSYSSIDQVSFVKARTLAPQPCSIYLNALTSTQTIFDQLEYSNAANIVLDGGGNVFYYVYDGTIPPGTPTVADRDYISFKTTSAVIDLYQTVVVQHDQDPSTGQYLTRQASDPGVVPRFGRVQTRTIPTYLKISDTAQTLANKLLALAQRPARKIKVITKGKLFDREVGTKVILKRGRAVDPDGALSGQTFRILNITKSPQEARVEADLVDDVVTVANLSCSVNCQTLCQLTSQGCAASTCESSCQGGQCQANCERTLQGCGSTVCMTTCQGVAQAAPGCSTGCQVSCQGCGQTTCQNTCQVSCQQCGQSGGPCQQTCETACQACGEAGHCQNACEAAPCQTACQVSSCQGPCQVACQASRELR